MALTKDGLDQRKDALKRLASAIPAARIEPATFVVFVENSQRYATEAFVLTCRRLERTCQFFPSYAEFEDELNRVSRHLAEQREQEQRARRLPPANPVSPEQLAQFKAAVAQVVAKRKMR